MSQSDHTGTRSSEILLRTPATQEQIPDSQKTMIKKKCRGNRQKQRYRRQLYNKGLNTEQVTALVNERFNSRLEPATLESQTDQSPSKTYPDRDLQVYIPLERVSTVFLIQ